MNGRTTRITFGENRVVVTEPLYQFDYGQSLVLTDDNLPDRFGVVISNGVHEVGEAFECAGNIIYIPNRFLQTGRDIFIWLLETNGYAYGQVEYVIHIPVCPRSPVFPEYNVQEAPSPFDPV